MNFQMYIRLKANKYAKTSKYFTICNNLPLLQELFKRFKEWGLLPENADINNFGLTSISVLDIDREAINIGDMAYKIKYYDPDIDKTVWLCALRIVGKAFRPKRAKPTPVANFSSRIFLYNDDSASTFGRY